MVGGNDDRNVLKTVAVRVKLALATETGNVKDLSHLNDYCLQLVGFYSTHFVCFRLFIVATGCSYERRSHKTVSCYGG